MSDNEKSSCDECGQERRCWLFEKSEPLDGDFENCAHILLCLRCAKREGVLKKHLFADA